MQSAGHSQQTTGDSNHLTESPLEYVSTLLDEYNGKFNAAAHYVCDRHDGESIALRYEDATGQKQSYSFNDLRDLSSRFANVLREMGVQKGDRVAILLPKSPELVISALAVWRLGAVHVPLFTAFGPQAVSHRVENSGAVVIITDIANRHKLDGTLDGTGAIDTSRVHVVTVNREDGTPVNSTDVPFRQALETATPLTEVVSVSADDSFVILYTSGTTGYPKGVEVPIKALAAFETYMRFGLDLRQDDVFWNMADPGWAYGLYYGLIGPLLLGKMTLMVNAPFNPDDTYRRLKEYDVTNFTAAPTVFRSMRAAGVPDGLKDVLHLRVLSCAGEPLNPEVGTWAKVALGLPIHDHFGQTEHGMVVNNHHHVEFRRALRAGSMGHSMPGFRAVVVNADGVEQPAGEEGQIAIDTENSPLFWFRGYYHDPERTAERFSAGPRYCYMGDAASRDEDGYIYFSGRADDIISSAGYRIGPFEVESALMAHEAVAEAAAVGIPDEQRGEVVKGFVVLRAGIAPSDELANELCAFVKGNLSKHAYPREIEFIESLPKTPSGKVQRFLLRRK